MFKPAGSSPHIVVIHLAHLETTVPFWNTSGIPVADDILERIAPLPLASVSSDIALHGVCSAEVVPGAYQMNGLDGGMCLSLFYVSHDPRHVCGK